MHTTNNLGDVLNKTIFDELIIRDFVNVHGTINDHAEIPYLAYTKTSSNELGLTLKKNFSVLQDRNVTMLYKMSQKNELQKTFAIDLDAMAYSALVIEAKQQILRSVMEEINRISDISYNRSLTGLDKFYSNVYKLFGATYKVKRYVKDAVSLKRVIAGHSMLIAVTSRIGKGDVCIVSKSIAELIKNHADAVLLDERKAGEFIYKFAILDGISYYVNEISDFHDDTIIVLRKPGKETEGIHFIYKKETIAMENQVIGSEDIEKRIINKFSISSTDNADKLISKIYVSVGRKKFLGIF